MPENQEYGGFWIRLLALLVDSAILFLLGGVIALLCAGLGAAAGEAYLLTLGMGLYTLIYFLYWPVMHASARQATFGKAMLGLKVVDNAGNRISFLRALGRFLATFVSGAVLMLGYLVAAFTARKQALHDLLASTLVVREGPAHIVGALAAAVAGFALPLVIVPIFVGGAMMAMVIGSMGAKQEAAKTVPTPAAPQVAKAKSPATESATRQAPAPTPQIAKPQSPAPASGDIETILAARLTGMEKPGTTHAGPTVLELANLLGGSFGIKTYLPPLTEFRGSGPVVAIMHVLDSKGTELYDAKHQLESEFFQRVSLSPWDSPVPHLAGTRSVNLRQGASASDAQRVEGRVTLSLPVNMKTARFGTADVGKEQTVHGMTVKLDSLNSKEAEIRFGGDRKPLAAVTGYGPDGKPVLTGMRPGSGGATKITFQAPAERFEMVIAESKVDREFPFTLTRTSVAGAPAAAGAAPSPAPKPVAETPQAAPSPAPAPVAKTAAAPAKAESAATVPAQAPKTKVAARVATPAPAQSPPKLDTVTPACVYKPVMTNEEIDRCRR